MYGDYYVTEEIGEGRNKVFLAENSRDEKVCLKVLRKSNNLLHQFRLRNEAAALSKLHHPNIIKFKELVETSEDLAVVIEYMDSFDLVDILIFRKKLVGEELARVMLSVASAMDYLHQRNICHRDIKPDNILVDEDGRVKLIDFEFASRFVPFKPTLKKVVGSAVYSSPELLRGEAYCGAGVDIWAFGVTLYACAFGRLPWAGKNNQQILANILKNPLPLPKDCPPHLASLLKGCLHMDPNKRLSSSQILNHPFFFKEKKVHSSQRARPSTSLSEEFLFEYPLFGEERIRAAKLKSIEV